MSEIPDNTIQCVVTSPPYWGLRKYAGEQDLIWGGNNHHGHEWYEYKRPPGGGHAGDKATVGATKADIQRIHEYRAGYCQICGAWRGAYGLEPTPEMYVQHTVEILREIKRVLRKDGVVFWNIGDSYNTVSGGMNQLAKMGVDKTPQYGAVKYKFDGVKQTMKGKSLSLKPKDLCLIPFRVAIAAQEDGWWVRSDIIWSKPNPMPESVTDRPTNSHEYIFMFTKSAKYYWDADAVREVATGFDGRRDTIMKPSGKYADRNQMIDGTNPNSVHARGAERWPNSVKYDGTNYGGNGTSFRGYSGYRKGNGEMMVPGRNIRSVWEFPTQPYPEAHFAVFPEKLPEICIKASSKEGDTVLDPFAGAGTTLKVAAEMGRRAIGYDISLDYCPLVADRNKQQVLMRSK